ncbi:hypothetical protein BDK51DRAFT_28317 [Blyttiomyces helicus]|uniref:Uncharacterized protein n=1 Tax=Blyttiomyces helicus TaxID=388810 RepID=A0A4P9WNZ5_9FUNG|nr:hypothetical protein BDK51DRAFT_28317 [Blyttiomyces helicus]|eukprot:RKO92496.1 hypothetical protein BDK51DRAFT_28317 [Blyttiomyces helicus]
MSSNMFSRPAQIEWALDEENVTTRSLKRHFDGLEQKCAADALASQKVSALKEELDLVEVEQEYSFPAPIAATPSFIATTPPSLPRFRMDIVITTEKEKGETQDLVESPKKRKAEDISKDVTKESEESEEPVAKRMRARPPKIAKSGHPKKNKGAIAPDEKKKKLEGPGYFLKLNSRGRQGRIHVMENRARKTACDLNLGHLLDLITDDVFPPDETDGYFLKALGYAQQTYIMWKAKEERKTVRRTLCHVSYAHPSPQKIHQPGDDKLAPLWGQTEQSKTDAKQAK